MKIKPLFLLPGDLITNFFSRGSERSVKAKKNILLLALIKGCSILIGLILVPVTIHYINPTRYGIWLTLSSMVAWFGFFDVGLGNGLRNKFAEAVTEGKDELARIYVSTTYALLSIIVIFVLIVFFFVNPLLDWSKLLNTPSNMSVELRSLAFIVFSFFCLQFILRLITTLLTANQQPARASVFDFLGSLLSLITIFILTKSTSGNLIYLGIVFSVMPVLVLTASSIWFYTHNYKKYAPSFKYINFKYARGLMMLGIKFFVIQMAVLILYQTSNIIIAQLFGPHQVTPYNIAYKYFSVITMGFSIIMVPFWSASTEAWIKKDILWIKNAVKKLIMLWSVFFVTTIVMLLSADFIFRLWIGKEIKVPLSISIVIAAYVLINSWNTIFIQFLNGIGKIKLQFYLSLFGALVNIPMAILLGKHLGIYGVLLSTCFLGIINAVWAPIQYTKLINNTATGIWNQ
jgi:O-antigen/teichoic acid export membrane protein